MPSGFEEVACPIPEGLLESILDNYSRSMFPPRLRSVYSFCEKTFPASPANLAGVRLQRSCVNAVTLSRVFRMATWTGRKPIGMAVKARHIGMGIVYAHRWLGGLRTRSIIHDNLLEKRYVVLTAGCRVKHHPLPLSDDVSEGIAPRGE
jgi:hypothetical protein